MNEICLRKSKKIKNYISSFKLNKGFLNLISLVCILLCFLYYELFFCNQSFIEAIIMKSDIIKYNFSWCRIIFYCVIIIIFIIKNYIIKAKDIEENVNDFFKLIVICGGMLINVIFTFLALKMFEVITLKSFALAIMTVSLLIYLIIHVSNNYSKNFILILFTFGILFSIGTRFNHIIDETKHFMSAYNVANFNYNFSSPIIDYKLLNIGHNSKFTENDKLLEEVYYPEIIQHPSPSDIATTPADYSPILYVFSALGIKLAIILHGSLWDMYLLGRIFNLVFYRCFNEHCF